jgi:hypothetical protein
MAKQHAMSAAPITPKFPFFHLARELRDRIYSFIWSDTELLIFKDAHVLTISYGPANPSAQPHLPKWLLLSQGTLSEGLEQFTRHAVCTSIKPAQRLEKPIYAHINDHALLLSCVRELRLDLALRCSEIPIYESNEYDALFTITPRVEYWCTLIPIDSGISVWDFLPNLTTLTLRIDCQNLEWVCNPRQISVMGCRETLGTRFQNVRLEVPPPVIESNPNELEQENEIPKISPIATTYLRLQNTLVRMCEMFSRTYIANLEDVEMEKLLHETYAQVEFRSRSESARPGDDPEIKDLRLLEAMKHRTERSREVNDWIDQETGTWHVEFTTSQTRRTSAPTNKTPNPQYQLQCIGLKRFAIVNPTNETVMFTLDDMPKHGSASYSCDVTKEVLWIDDNNITGYTRDNGPTYSRAAPPQPKWRPEITDDGELPLHTIPAPPRREGVVRGAWEWRYRDIGLDLRRSVVAVSLRNYAICCSFGLARR